MYAYHSDPNHPEKFWIKPDTRLFLASQSPRRKALLVSAGLEPWIVTSRPGHDAEALERPMDHEVPTDYVLRVALAKLKTGVAALLETPDRQPQQPQPGDLVLAADTTVALDGHILGKPTGPAQAHDLLSQLSGRTHQVHTAVTVTRLESPTPHHCLVSTQVTFAPLDSDWIAAYVASGEPMDKAGAYGIQGAAAAVIPFISGSYSAVVGLPLYETLMLIRQADQE